MNGMYPTALYDGSQELPEAIDQTHLHENGLFVVQGLTTALAEQLVVASRQPHLSPFCEGDKERRFADRAHVIEWQAQGRLALPLVRRVGDDALKLSGFGWFGAKTPDPELGIKGATSTFAVRLYEGALRQGNALPYTQAMIAAHQAAGFSNQGLWLESWASNTYALRAYKEAGFTQVAEAEGELDGEIVPRIYMQFDGR